MMLRLMQFTLLLVAAAAMSQGASELSFLIIGDWGKGYYSVTAFLSLIYSLTMYYLTHSFTHKLLTHSQLVTNYLTSCVL